MVEEQGDNCTLSGLVCLPTAMLGPVPVPPLVSTFVGDAAGCRDTDLDP